ncbi:MAG: capsular biosynthesis protein [Planctomycetes bacterium]|nr:capsular biosynthesis protein [Planctomycetota bacterium]
MIDLHCHILPGLDDGAKTLEDAVKMARLAAQDGIKTIVATPHSFDGTFEVSLEARDAALQELQAVLDQEEIPIQLLPGSDCHISEHLLTALQESPGYTLNLAGKAFLVEWPQEVIPSGFKDFLFEAQLADLLPILTHPERHAEIQHKPELIGNLVARGLKIQVTAASLTGLFGHQARETAEFLLDQGWVDVLATDAHNPEIRTPTLSEGLACAENIIGKAAINLVTTNPARLLGLA